MHHLAIPERYPEVPYPVAARAPAFLFHPVSVHLPKLRASPLPLPLLMAGLLFSAGCDSAQEQDRFADAASIRPEGFTQTSTTGEILSEDPDDWRQAPLFAGQFYVSDPAFPNPATFGADGIVTVSVQVQFDDVFPGGLRVSARTPPSASYPNGRFVSGIEVRPEAQRAGSYSFQLPTSTLANGSRGLARVLLLTANGEIVSYGDVLIQ